MNDLKTQLLNAAKLHVAFDGWSPTTFQAAIADSGADATMARAACPRGALDLAVAYHREGDAAMTARMMAEDLSQLRYSEKVSAAIRFRLEAIEDKELVRRGTTLFALPQNAGEGSKLIWGTADAIWDALGDTSDDVNWYTKRATLSAVYGSVVLYWLGDDSLDHQDSWAFIDRRIANVMQFEAFKKQVRAVPILSSVLEGTDKLLSGIKRPPKFPKVDLPGSWTQS